MSLDQLTAANYLCVHHNSRIAHVASDSLDGLALLTAGDKPRIEWSARCADLIRERNLLCAFNQNQVMYHKKWCLPESARAELSSESSEDL
jgi:hypothetical protein